MRSASSSTKASTCWRLTLFAAHGRAADRRGNQELHALAQRRGLRLHVDAAEHDGAAQPDVLAVDANAFLDLGRELARRGQNQGAHRMPAGRSAGIGVPGEPLQERSGIPAVLPVPSARRQDVASLQHQGDRLRLDRVGSV